MRHHNTLLHNLLQFIPWNRLEALVDEHGSDRRVRKLSSKSQLIALVHAQLTGASSLRLLRRRADQLSRWQHAPMCGRRWDLGLRSRARWRLLVGFLRLQSS